MSASLELYANSRNIAKDLQEREQKCSKALSAFLYISLLEIRWENGVRISLGILVRRRRRRRC